LLSQWRRQAVKIGNAMWPERRLSALNSRRYGAITDWALLYHAKFDEAGKIELAAHGRLYGYRRGMKEIFRCNYALARKALVEAAEGYLGEDEWESRYALWQYTFADE
jgi:T5orf172 domain